MLINEREIFDKSFPIFTARILIVLSVTRLGTRIPCSGDASKTFQYKLIDIGIIKKRLIDKR